jgi:alcohol dehydrogenase class IV
MNFLESADWNLPIPIHYGPGRIAELGAICRTAGMRKPLLVTDRGSRDLSFISAALASLQQAGGRATIFSEVSPNPTDRDVAQGRQHFHDGAHDGVVAIGGGSGMDAGKAISLVANNQHDIWAFDYDNAAPPSFRSADFVPLVCIPTTAGTGAETESTAMLTHTERAVKGCVWHASHKPHAALLDPQLTLELPVNLTAWTGVDALVHAIEALTVPAFHPPCDALALEAIRLIYRWLPSAVHDGTNLQARGAMLVGSCLAGVSFLKGLGLVHAMSHMIGAVHNTHHGLTNAVLLPLVLRHNRSALGEKTALMCRAMDLPQHDFEAFYTAIVALLNELDIPTSLSALGIDSESLAELARKSHGDAACATNAQATSVADINALLTEAMLSVR